MADIHPRASVISFWPERATHHVIRDDGQVAVVDADTVRAEHIAHFLNDGPTRRLDTIRRQDGVYVV
jgi:hypothetical protein